MKTEKGENAKSVSEQDIHNLYLKAEKGGYPLEVVLEVFIRGVESNLYEQCICRGYQKSWWKHEN